VVAHGDVIERAPSGTFLDDSSMVKDPATSLASRRGRVPWPLPLVVFARRVLESRPCP